MGLNDTCQTQHSLGKGTVDTCCFLIQHLLPELRNIISSLLWRTSLLHLCYMGSWFYTGQPLPQPLALTPTSTGLWVRVAAPPFTSYVANPGLVIKSLSTHLTEVVTP